MQTTPGKSFMFLLNVGDGNKAPNTEISFIIISGLLFPQHMLTENFTG